MGGGKTQTMTQDTELSKAQAPFMTDLLRQAQALQRQGGPDPYTGKMLADLSPDVTAGQNYVRNYAQGTSQDLIGAQNQALVQQLGAPDMNSPVLRDAQEAAIRPVVRQFNESVLPQIRNDAVAAGGFGGSRQGLAEGVASDRLQQNILDTTSKMALDYYGQGLTAQGRGLALAPQAIQAGALPGQMLDAVGQQQMEYQQQLINEQIQRFQDQEMQPWNNLGMYQSLISGNMGSSTTSQLAKTNPLMSALGGAAVGGGLGAALGGAAKGSTYGWWGAAAGALLGLFGAMG